METGEVIVKVVEVVPATLVALAAWRAAHKAARQTKPNGGGTLPQMAERLLADVETVKHVQGEALRRLDAHEASPDAHTRR